MTDVVSFEPSRSDVARRTPAYEPQPARVAWSINVLLVEDDPADTSLIVNVLRRHSSVSNAHALDDPDLALKQLKSGQLKPDLVLLDIHMPRIDGFEFLERLRQIPAMGTVPVVFLTTSCLARDVVEARHGSAASYVIKPDTYLELQGRLDTVIRRTMSGIWSK